MLQHRQRTSTAAAAECRTPRAVRLWEGYVCELHGGGGEGLSFEHYTGRALLQVIRHTSHVTRHTSHVTRHTSHVTRHTSHATRHTSHVTCSHSPLRELMCPASSAEEGGNLQFI